MPIQGQYTALTGADGEEGQYTRLPQPDAVVDSLNGLTGDVTLSAGSNITLTPVGNNITIAASGGGGAVDSVNGQTGVVVIEAIDVPYDNAASGLSATEVQGAIDELAASGGGGANLSLSNLDDTSINKSLIADSNNAFSLGNSTFRWKDTYTRRIFVGATQTDLTINNTGVAQSSDALVNFNFTTGDTSATDSKEILVKTGDAADAFLSGNLTIRSGSSGTAATGAIDIRTGGSGGDATGGVSIGTGASSANTGDITLITGVSGASRGIVLLDGAVISANANRIITVANPTSAQDAATKSYVDSESVELVSGDATLDANSSKVILLDLAATGSFTITLPTGSQGRNFSFGFSGSGVTTYTLAAAGGDSLDANLTALITGPLKIVFSNDTVAWHAIG